MLIGALTTRAKAMSSQSKYQWNDQECEKNTEYFGVEREEKISRIFFFLRREIFVFCVNYWVVLRKT